MAKKKQFAGKKTKLAKLPLTQALANRVESGKSAPAPVMSLPSSLKQQPPAWEEVNTSGKESLGATFLFLIRELADLSSGLQAAQAPPLSNHRILLPKRIPEPMGLLGALREARESLQDLKGLLSGL